MSLISDKMNKQSFRSFYYALYVYHDYFTSTNTTASYIQVQNTVLSNFTEAQQYTIYNVPRYGLNSAKSMVYWVDCALEYN